MDMNERLDAAISASGLTKAELSRALGISTATMTCYTKGKCEPSLKTFRRMCIELDVSSDWLLGLDYRRVTASDKLNHVLARCSHEDAELLLALAERLVTR